MRYDCADCGEPQFDMWADDPMPGRALCENCADTDDDDHE